MQLVKYVISIFFWFKKTLSLLFQPIVSQDFEWEGKKEEVSNVGVCIVCL